MSEPEVLIHTQHLFHNIQTLLKLSSPRKIFPVIKANAYGHGILNIAHFLEKKFSIHEIPLFCVARLSEAIQLRNAGIRRRVLVMSHFDEVSLSGHSSPIESVDLALHDFQDFETAIKLLSEKTHLGWGLQINFNTGMNRQGFSFSELNQSIRDLMDCIARAHEQEIPVTGLMTHFARGEEPVENFTRTQLERFQDCVMALKKEWKKNLHGDFPIWIHAENSGALGRSVGKDSPVLNATRPGLHVWGSEADEAAFKGLGLKTVMQVRAPVRQVFKVSKGEAIGYGAAYRCARDTLVGTVPLGYADGVPRILSRSTDDPLSRIGLMIEGKRVQILGRVSMDLLCVELTDHPRASEWGRLIKAGERPDIWAYWIGEGQSAKDIALELKTIDYEVFCMVAARLNRREVY